MVVVRARLFCSLCVPRLTQFELGNEGSVPMSPAISLREAERGAQNGLGRDPQWHQRTDVFATYDDKDFRMGLNAAQTNAGCQ